MGILVSGDFTSVERLLLPSSCCWKMRGRRQLIHCRDLRPCRLQGPSLLLAAALLLTLATPAAAGKSKLWGSAGEAWSPSGRLMDWSYAGEPGRAEAAAGRANACGHWAPLGPTTAAASSRASVQSVVPARPPARPPAAGYHQGNAPLPQPPVTRPLSDFQRGKSDTEALQAALDWAHRQPNNGGALPRRVGRTTALLGGSGDCRLLNGGRAGNILGIGNEQSPHARARRPSLAGRQAGRQRMVAPGALSTPLPCPPARLPAEWCVIGLPAGTLTLTRQLHIKRPRLVLRGAGSGRTVLRVDKPLKDIPGVPRPNKPWGYYVQEAFIMVTGRYLRDEPLASVTGRANRGDQKLTVGAPARLLGLLRQPAQHSSAQPTTFAHAAEP